jgi:hypothetical protein
MDKKKNFLKLQSQSTYLHILKMFIVTFAQIATQMRFKTKVNQN